MSLKERLSADLRNALKGKRTVDVSALRLLSAAVLNKEKEKMKELNEEELMEVVSSEAKKRREAIEGFEKGGRVEMAEKEQQELAVIMGYLPEQLSAEEIQKLIKEAIAKVGAQEMKDMGKVMAELSPRIKGKADAGMVSRLVKESLTENQ